MDFIIKPRGSGKTFDLVRMSAETGIPIVCTYPTYVRTIAADHGLTIPMRITPEQFRENPPEHVYIDNLEYTIGNLLGVNVEACTVSMNCG